MLHSSHQPSPGISPTRVQKHHWRSQGWGLPTLQTHLRADKVGPTPSNRFAGSGVGRRLCVSTQLSWRHRQKVPWSPRETMRHLTSLVPSPECTSESPGAWVQWCHSWVGSGKKDKHHRISLHAELKKKRYKWTYLQNRNRFTDIGSKLTKSWGGGTLGKTRSFGWTDTDYYIQNKLTRTYCIAQRTIFNTL